MPHYSNNEIAWEGAGAGDSEADLDFIDPDLVEKDDESR
jgi:hypothetical protein